MFGAQTDVQKSMALSVSQQVTIFSLYDKCEGKSKRIDFNSSYEKIKKGPDTSYKFVVERPAEWKSVRLSVAKMSSHLEGYYKRVYKARNISLHPDNFLAAKQYLKTIPDFRICHLNFQTYVHSCAKDSVLNKVILAGMKMHQKMMTIPEIAASPQCPQLPEQTLPPLIPYPDIQDVLFESWQSRFNCDLLDAALEKEVPLSDIKSSAASIPFTRINAIESCISAAEFLKLLHKNFIIHRDVHVGNIGIRYNEFEKKFGVIVFDFDRTNCPRITLSPKDHRENVGGFSVDPEGFSQHVLHIQYDQSTLYGANLPSSDIYSLILTVARSVFRDMKYFKYKKNIFAVSELEERLKKRYVADLWYVLRLPLPEPDFTRLSRDSFLGKVFQYIKKKYVLSKHPNDIQEGIDCITKKWTLTIRVLNLLELASEASSKLYQHLRKINDPENPVGLNLLEKFKSSDPAQRQEVIDELTAVFGLSMDDVIARLGSILEEIK